MHNHQYKLVMVLLCGAAYSKLGGHSSSGEGVSQPASCGNVSCEVWPVPEFSNAVPPADEGMLSQIVQGYDTNSWFHVWVCCRVLTWRAGPAAAGSWGSVCGMAPAVALPWRAVLKSLMDLVFVLLQHLQSTPCMLDNSKTFPELGPQRHQ